MTASASGADDRPGPLTVLIDDARDFKDGRPAMVVRSSAGAVRLLTELSGTVIDDLWLDYDLIGEDTSQPVVDLMVALAHDGEPLAALRIHVHSSNIRHGHRICAELVAAGYPARRSFAANMWVRAPLPRAGQNPWTCAGGGDPGGPGAGQPEPFGEDLHAGS